MSTEQQQPDPVAALVAVMESSIGVLRYHNPGASLLGVVALARQIAAAAKAVVTADDAQFRAELDALHNPPSPPVEEEAADAERT
jgi:hypothetical protein